MNFGRLVRLFAAVILTMTMMVPAATFASDLDQHDEQDDDYSVASNVEEEDDDPNANADGDDQAVDDTGNDSEQNVDETGDDNSNGGVPGNENTELTANPTTIFGSVIQARVGPVAGAEVCINSDCMIAVDGTFSIDFEGRGDGDFVINVTADGYEPAGMSLSLADWESSAFEVEVFIVKEGHGGNWAYDPNAIIEVCETTNGTQQDATYRLQDMLDLHLVYFNDTVGLSLTESGAETMTLGPCEPGQGQPGGGSQAPIPGHEGSFNDPESGNSFAFLSAHRMCDDNSLLVTWTGTNLVDLMFAVYNPSPGWGTDWLDADLSSSVFTTEIDRDTAYFVDAGVYFEDGSIEKVSVSIPDCTPAPDAGGAVPDAGIGDNNLRVQVNVPGGADISGAPYSLFAPQAAAQAITTPYVSGFVGANNTVAIDGLVPGQYRLVIYLGNQEPIDVLITVGDQTVTNAVITLEADGTAAVSYPGQAQTPTPAPTAPADKPKAPETPKDKDPAAQPRAAAATDSDLVATSSGTTVSGLPSTGTGSTSATGVGAIALATAAAALALMMIQSRFVWNTRRGR